MYSVVRLMPCPQKAMHNVLVGKPRDAFHEKKGSEYDSDVNQ